MHILLNNQLLPQDAPVFSRLNRAFRYGDGFFETIKCVHGRLLWWDYHQKRIFNSFEQLRFDMLDAQHWEQLPAQILQLCEANRCLEAARIRMSFFRDDGGLYAPISHKANYLIEAIPLPQYSPQTQPATICGGIASMLKPLSPLSSLKSLQCLPYVLAGIEAQQKGWDQAILLNNHGYVAETHIANIFIVKHQQIFTPPLTEGCIQGIIRMVLLEAHLPWNITEAPISVTDLFQADEVLATNTILGVRYFRQIENKCWTSWPIGQKLAEWLYRQEL
ncbi:MAG: aminotransferase class IV [Thermoflavifilum sp.]|nr:aminotransferase class IV [Thermoflavifilum sp.]